MKVLGIDASLRGTGLAVIDQQGTRTASRHWEVVKLGAQGCRLPDGIIIPPAEVLAPVDTSGAGDALNAGYLGARLNGADPASAAREGHALAGWTIMRPGACPSRDP